MNNLKKWIEMNAKIEIKDMPKINLAYTSSIGSQNLASAYQKLIQWAAPKNLFNEKTRMITIYHDSLKVTDESKARMSACMVVNEAVKPEGDVGSTSIEAGEFIIGHFEIGMEDFEKSWTGLYLWMNEHGYQRADKNSFEIYHNNFNDHPEKKAIVDFCIPIE